MKNIDEILNRLFREAAEPTQPQEMPFGFDTRVLALARQSLPNGSAVIALFARRAAALAVAVIALATIGLYRFSDTSSDLPNEYTMADSAIQSDLGE